MLASKVQARKVQGLMNVQNSRGATGVIFVAFTKFGMAVTVVCSDF